MTERTEEEHLRNLEELLGQLEQAGLRLKRSKCSFMLELVEYLGHKILAKGLQPTDEKIRVVRDAPAPKYSRPPLQVVAEKDEMDLGEGTREVLPGCKDAANI